MVGRGGEQATCDMSEVPVTVYTAHVSKPSSLMDGHHTRQQAAPTNLAVVPVAVPHLSQEAAFLTPGLIFLLCSSTKRGDPRLPLRILAWCGVPMWRPNLGEPIATQISDTERDTGCVTGIQAEIPPSCARQGTTGPRYPTHLVFRNDLTCM